MGREIPSPLCLFPLFPSCLVLKRASARVDVSRAQKELVDVRDQSMVQSKALGLLKGSSKGQRLIGLLAPEPEHGVANLEIALEIRSPNVVLEELKLFETETVSMQSRGMGGIV